MKTIVAGSRSIIDYKTVEWRLNSVNQEFKVTELIHGGAKGVDELAGRWALEYGIPISVFKADWSNINVPGAVVKINKYGKKYNALAGFQRNIKMAEYGEALVAIWDGKSRGTKHMIEEATKRSLLLKVFLTT